MGLQGGAHVGRDPAPAQDEDAVAGVRQLLGVAGDQQHGRAVVGRLADERVDLRAGADVDALGRLVEQHHGRLAPQPAGQDDLLGVATRQRLDRLRVLADPDQELAYGVRGVLLLVAVAEHQAGEVRAGAAGADVVPDAVALEQGVELALLRDVGDAGRHGRGRRGEGDRAPAEREGAAGDRVGAEDHPEQLRAACPEQPGDAQHLAPVQVEGDVGQRSAAQPACGQHDVAARCVGRVGEHAVQRTADDELDEVVLGEPGGVDRRDLPAVAQHGDAVGDRQHLVQAVADVEDRLAGAGVATQAVEQVLDLLGRQRGGRLVEHQHAAGGVVAVLDRADDRDPGAVGGTQRAEHRRGRGVDPEQLEQVGGPGVQRLPVDLAAAVLREGRAEGDVLGDREVGEHRRLLVHEAQAGGVRLLTGPAVQVLGARAQLERRAGLGVDDPGQHLDQGGLARAVAAEQRVHLARTDLEVDAVQREHAVVGLGELGDPQHRRRQR